MHAAPSVSYPVGRSRWLAGCLALLWVAGGAALAAWCLQAPVGWRQGLGGAVWAGCGAVALVAWLRSPAGTLAWDGARWTWAPGPDAFAGTPVLALDLQSRLLLRWAGEDGGRLWLWTERKAAPAYWDALRRAVYSRANTTAPGAAPAPDAAQPPVAER